MKRLWLACWAAVLACAMTGCVNLPAVVPMHDTKMPDEIVWNRFEEWWGSDEWLLEAQKRWDHPILFCCHGGTATGTWLLYPDPPRKVMKVEDMAWALHNLYPDNDIILCVCNRDGLEINVPRVWYAKSLVWQTPDEYAFYHELAVGHGSVGNVWEFVTMRQAPATQPSTQPATRPTTNPSNGPDRRNRPRP